MMRWELGQPLIFINMIRTGGIPRIGRCIYCRSVRFKSDDSSRASLAEDIKKNPTQLRKLLSNLFSPSPTATDALSKYHRRTNLSRMTTQHPVTRPGIEASPEEFLAKYPFATNVLYWNSLGISLNKSDFERLLPPKQLRTGVYRDNLDTIDFDIVRSRNPDNLTPWFGYYLVFNSRDAAAMYYQETLGTELCGLQLRLRFIEAQTAKGLHSPILDKAPQVSRRNCALVLGLPDGFPALNIIRTLWDYDFIDDDKLAVEQLPVGKIRYGGGPFLLRFQNEEEPQRLVREFNKRVFPHTQNEVQVEVVD